MKIAVYSRGGESLEIRDVLLLLKELEKVNITTFVHTGCIQQIKDAMPDAEFPVFDTADDLDDSFECLLSLGGDGTMLDTVTLVKDSNIPVLGVNFGRLGFLANIGRDELKEAVDALVNRTYLIDKRSLIHLDANIPLFGDTPYALNEFAIHKRDTGSMIKIFTYLNGELLNTYWADGLIVSTPTGSTGYSLSCNGPIVFPDSSSFIITPVAPHNLNVRPVIIPNNHIVSFEVEGRSSQFICTLDSRKEIVENKTQIAIKKEQFTFSLMRLNENSFLQTLRNKLLWGLDKRN